jgi:hypothetical protein
MNPTLTNSYTDIFWRDIAEDDSIFQRENKQRLILVITEETNSLGRPLVTFAKDVDILSNEDYGHNEVVKFYAFLT